MATGGSCPNHFAPLLAQFLQAGLEEFGIKPNGLSLASPAGLIGSGPAEGKVPSSILVRAHGFGFGPPLGRLQEILATDGHFSLIDVSLPLSLPSPLYGISKKKVFKNNHHHLWEFSAYVRDKGRAGLGLHRVGP